MKKLLWMNYIYAAISILALINIVINSYEGIVSFFGSALVPITIILTILFFRGEVKISKGLVLTLNILICVMFLSIVLALGIKEGISQFVSFAIPTLIIGLPFPVNVYMLYKDRYKEL